MYSLAFDVNGATLTIEGEDPKALMTQYEHLHGDGTVLLDNIEAAVKDYESGKLAMRAAVNGAAAAVADEPEADEKPARSSRGSGKPAKAESDDPWGVPPEGDEEPAERRTAPSRAKSRRAAPEPDDDDSGEGGDVYTSRDKFGREWTMNLPDAPECDCGDGSKAARMKAKSQAGKRYTKFRCAKAGPEGQDGSWRDKCDYDEFPPR